MRTEYYQYIQNNNIADILSLILDLSFTEKHRILENILKEYTSEECNQALIYYQKKYIELHRVNYNCIDKTLLCLCKLIREKGRL